MPHPLAAALIAAAAAAATTSAAPAPPPASGEYGQLKLAFDGGRVTGTFNETRQGNGTENAPQFSCSFALTGAWRGGDGSAAVLTWWPGDDPADERIPGRLTVRGGNAELKLAEDPGGCSMTGELFKAEGYSERLTLARAWREVREVKRARAHLSDAPGGPPRRGYVAAGDRVGVLARSGAFAHVQFVDGRGVTEGWLPLADLQPASP